MERNIPKNGLVNLVLLLAAAVGAYLVARAGNSPAGQAGASLLGVGVLVAAVSWFQSRLEERERLEKLEFDELRRSATGSALFTASESEILPAQRSREQFERIFVPVFTGLLVVLQLLAAVYFWRDMTGRLQMPPVDLQFGMAFFSAVALILFLVGRFSAVIARLQRLPLLQPSATYLLLGAFVCAFIAAGQMGVWMGYREADLYLGKAFCLVLGLVATETLLNLILEFYRPRVKGKVERPVYDSRLVGLLGQPEALVTTAAQTLDYQFGFKVSDTWFYRFFESALGWLLLIQLALVIGSSCFVVVNPGEQALLERFGRPVAGRTPLGPGPHFKFPWPIDQAYRYPTDRIQSFIIGSEPDPKQAGNKLVLWASPHLDEQNFLVANRDLDAIDATNGLGGVTAPAAGGGATNRPPPGSLLSTSIPVHYQITNLVAWAYNNEDPSQLLKYLANREVIRYLVGVDLNDVMSTRRWEAATTLRDRIQRAADEHHMGAQIVFVGVQDIHPPTKVAPDYEKGVGATITRQTQILDAQSHAHWTNVMAQAHASNIVSVAQTDRLRRTVNQIAQEAVFTNQIPAFEASPSVFIQRAYLATVSRAMANSRSYLLLGTNSQEVMILNLEDKLRKDMFDSISVPTPKSK